MFLVSNMKFLNVISTFAGNIDCYSKISRRTSHNGNCLPVVLLGSTAACRTFRHPTPHNIRFRKTSVCCQESKTKIHQGQSITGSTGQKIRNQYC